MQTIILLCTLFLNVRFSQVDVAQNRIRNIYIGIKILRIGSNSGFIYVMDDLKSLDVIMNLSRDKITIVDTVAYQHES